MTFVRGWREIGEVFGVSGRVARRWHSAGAPILVLENKPVTELEGLWRWLWETYGKDQEPLGMSAAEAKRKIPEDGEKALFMAVLKK